MSKHFLFPHQVLCDWIWNNIDCDRFKSYFILSSKYTFFIESSDHHLTHPSSGYTTNFASWFLLGVNRSRQLDMGTSWYSWWKLIDFGVLRWKEGSHSCTLSCPDCWLLKRPYLHLRTPKSINFHQANQLVPMSNCHAANFVVACPGSRPWLDPVSRYPGSQPPLSPSKEQRPNDKS